jgi:predicted nuclease of predicted toxin-antitoxin system
LKFLVDMPLAPALAACLRKEGHDVVHAADLGLSSAPDTEILAYARRDGRTIVTANLDYPRLLALAQSESPSLILFRDGNWSDADVVVRMTELLRALPASDLAQSIIVVERDRIRRRKLPVARLDF